MTATPDGVTRADLNALGWTSEQIDALRATHKATAITRPNNKCTGWTLAWAAETAQATGAPEPTPQALEDARSKARAKKKVKMSAKTTEKMGRRPTKAQERAADQVAEEMFYALKDGTLYDSAYEAAADGLVSRTAIKERPGWTDAAIRKFLGDGDAVAPNPHNRYSLMRLHRLETVQQVEASREFVEWAEKSLARRKVDPVDALVAQAETVTKDAARVALHEKIEQDRAAREAAREAEQIAREAAKVVREAELTDLARLRPVFRQRKGTGRGNGDWVLEGADLAPGRFEEVLRRDGTLSMVKVAEIVAVNADLLVASFTRHKPKPGDTIKRVDGAVEIVSGDGVRSSAGPHPI